MVPEAPLEDTEAGLVPAWRGWFVMNARYTGWFHRPGRGDNLPLTGAEQEDFLVLAGEALLIVDGQERPLVQWDFVHCPLERLLLPVLKLARWLVDRLA